MKPLSRATVWSQCGCGCLQLLRALFWSTFSSRTTYATDSEMPRLIHVVLAIVLGVPTLGFGGAASADSFELVSPTCCDSNTQTGQQPVETEIGSACCCKPYPAGPGTESLNAILSQLVFGIMQPSPMNAIVTPALDAYESFTSAGAARGPPPKTSLYSLRIALLV